MVNPALKQKISALAEEKDFIVLAIDGPCASGKTFLARSIAEQMNCNVIHTDDFFLRPEQRTPERLGEVGGNLDRERFEEEVLQPLMRHCDFSYRPYDCVSATFAKAVFVPAKKITVVEGSYSHHPYFGDSYDLRIFLTVSPEEQRKRLLLRDPEKTQRFLTEWIPKEEAYFSRFFIREKADLIL